MIEKAEEILGELGRMAVKRPCEEIRRREKEMTTCKESWLYYGKGQIVAARIV